jgi:hypothetical protein
MNFTIAKGGGIGETVQVRPIVPRRLKYRLTVMSALHDVLWDVRDTKPGLSRHFFLPPVGLSGLFPNKVALSGAYRLSAA